MLMSRYRMLKRFVHDPFGIRKSGFNALETRQSEIEQTACMDLNTAELTCLSQKSDYDYMVVAACETDNNFRLCGTTLLASGLDSYRLWRHLYSCDLPTIPLQRIYDAVKANPLNGKPFFSKDIPYTEKHICPANQS